MAGSREWGATIVQAVGGARGSAQGAGYAVSRSRWATYARMATRCLRADSVRGEDYTKMRYSHLL